MAFRAPSADWAAEQSVPREVAEALAHVLENQVEAAYRRSDLFEKRRALMEQWAGNAWVPGAEEEVPIMNRRKMTTSLSPSDVRELSEAVHAAASIGLPLTALLTIHFGRVLPLPGDPGAYLRRSIVGRLGV
jgi:hypothetical protein